MLECFSAFGRESESADGMSVVSVRLGEIPPKREKVIQIKQNI